MELLVGIVTGLLILVFLVVIHELGHAIAARRNGVVVEEFGIGFPPRALGKKLKNGVLLSLNWLPLGGFVKLQGEHDAADKKGDYGAATFWQKTKILFAGVAINWLFAALLLTLLALTGLPKVVPNQFSIPADTRIDKQPVQIAGVSKDTPAERAELKTGDKFILFNGEDVSTIERLQELSKANAGKTVSVVVLRGGEEQNKKVTLNAPQGQPALGVGLNQSEELVSTWSAPLVGLGTAAQFSWLTLQGLGDVIGNFFSGLVLKFSPDQAVRAQGDSNIQTASNGVSGPIGILGVFFPAVQKAGFEQLVFFTALISLSLAVMNALPIPAFDGGRWFVTALYRVLKRPLTKEREEKVQATGFFIMMGLVVLVTVADVTKFF